MTKEQIAKIRIYTWLDLTFQNNRIERIYKLYKANLKSDDMENDITKLLIILKLLGLTADAISK